MIRFPSSSISRRRCNAARQGVVTLLPPGPSFRDGSDAIESKPYGYAAFMRPTPLIGSVAISMSGNAAKMDRIEATADTSP